MRSDQKTLVLHHCAQYLAQTFTTRTFYLQLEEQAEMCRIAVPHIRDQ